MYLDVNVEAMIKLYEAGLCNIEDYMIFEEIKKNNYDKDDIFHVLFSNRFTKKINYDTDDEFKFLRKLIKTILIRKREISNSIYNLKSLVDSLDELKKGDIKLFEIYFEIVEFELNSTKEYIYDPKWEDLQFIIRPIENTIKNNNKYWSPEMGFSVSKLSNTLNIPIEISMLLLYSLTNIDYYIIELIGYIEDNSDKLTSRNDLEINLTSLSRKPGGLLSKVDGYVNMLNSIDKILENPNILMSTGTAIRCMETYEYLSMIRDVLTRFVMDYNL